MPCLSPHIAQLALQSTWHVLHLAELAKRLGKPSFLISSPEAVPSELLEYDTIGLTAGASAPDELIAAVKRRIENNGR